MKEICVDRSCVIQPMGAHYVEYERVLFKSAIDDPRVNRTLESLKDARGRRCRKCGQSLIYTDGDHSFCDPCWDEMVGQEEE